MRTVTGFSLGILLLVSSVMAETPDPVMGTELYLPPYPVAPSMQPPSSFLDYIGDPEQFGETWYDYQHNGSMSRMLAYGPDGSVHCSWMKGVNEGASDRIILYNKRLPGGTWLYGADGIQVNTTIRCGYCTLDLDMSGEPVIAYHGYDAGTTNYIFVWNSTGEHACPGYPPGVLDMAWPHVCVDTRDYIHVVCQTNPTGIIYYTRSEDGGLNWTDWVEVANWTSGGGVSQTICSDPVTGKVAIGYCQPAPSTYQEDVYYVESLDGVSWDFVNPVNITNFGAGGHPMSSTTRAYADVNLLYDNSGDLHLVYTSVPYPTFADGGGMIWYWSEAIGHRKVTGTFEETSWIEFHDPGNWQTGIGTPHISMGDLGVLYCQWGQCTTPGDESSGGYGNFDVYATYSVDGGTNWMSPVNVTDTATPGAPPGQCWSEAWANMAKIATDKLHIQYVFDLDAGGIPHTEGSWTLNPMFYQGVPVDSILTNMVVTVEPDTFPVVIPPEGGSINYTFSIENQGDYVVHFDGWIDVELPNSSIYEILLRPGITMNPGMMIARSMTQFVPGAAPAGDYSFMIHVGDYGWNIWGENSFGFTKLGMDASGSSTWACTGWEEMAGFTYNQPETYLLTSCYPNPFNPVTTIRFELPAVDFVHLTIFDVSGRLVTELINGWRDPGVHEVTFDASTLTSGIYLYRLEAGPYTASGKMLLMK